MVSQAQSEVLANAEQAAAEINVQRLVDKRTKELQVGCTLVILFLQCVYVNHTRGLQRLVDKRTKELQVGCTLVVLFLQCVSESHTWFTETPRRQKNQRVTGRLYTGHSLLTVCVSESHMWFT